VNSIDRIRGLNWRPVGLLLLGAVVLVVAIWTTQRGKTTAFPAPLLQAVGLLLTGLVFVLALAQSRLSRTADAAAENARHSEEVVIDSYLEHPEAVTTMDLWERAGSMRAALLQTGPEPEKESKEDARRILREARRPVENWGTAAVDLYRIDRELDRSETDPKPPSPRRRRYLQKERQRIIEEDKRARYAAERAGVTVAGYKRVIGRARVGELSVLSLVAMAQVFIVAMLGLVVVGAIYAGWFVERTPSPEVWAALVLIALAGTYVRVVRHDIDLEIAALTAALRDSTLVALHTAEHLLEADAREQNRDHRKVIYALLDQVDERNPGLPWMASIRGRLHLTCALVLVRGFFEGDKHDAHNSRRWQSLSEELRPATRLLGYAACRKDDPVAALAQARLLTVHAEILERKLVEGTPDFFSSSDPEALRAAATEQVRRAIPLLRDVSLFGRKDPLFGRSYRGWIGGQAYLWPRNDVLRDELAEALRLTGGDAEAMRGAGTPGS
jgi:hypothetical protein